MTTATTIRRRIAAAFAVTGLLALLPFAAPAHLPLVADARAQTTEEKLRADIKIPIPGLSLTEIDVRKQASKAGFIDIPWIGEYVNGVYSFAVGFATVIAIVMVMIGGLQYTTAGGDATRVTKAKKRITDAFSGLVLLLMATLLLRTVNPKLVEFEPIRIPMVDRKVFETISSANIISATGKPAMSSAAMMKLALEKAKAKGGDKFACFVYASMVHESGGKQAALGHDENATSVKFSVGARRRFIASGEFYSHSTFPAVACNDRACQNQGPLNDDVGTFDVTKPPEYGLDWKYSHGFGSGQSTIFPKSPPCPGRDDEGRGFVSGGKCYSIPDLLDADKQAEAMVDHYKRCWGLTGDGTNAAAGYVCYAGTIEADNPIIVARVSVYDSCVAKIAQ